jgi:hypothetical protein
VVRDADLSFVAWADRARERVPACLFTGSDTLPDAIAAQLIAATATRLPDVAFDLAGPVCDHLGAVPTNVRLHGEPDPELFRRARLGLDPLIAVQDSRDRIVDFARAGLPVIASPEASRGFGPALAECCLLCSPEPESLRDAIVESLEWDWSGPVAAARRILGVLEENARFADPA